MSCFAHLKCGMFKFSKYDILYSVYSVNTFKNQVCYLFYLYFIHCTVYCIVFYIIVCIQTNKYSGDC